MSTTIERIVSLSQAGRDLQIPITKVHRLMSQIGIEPILFGHANLKGITESNVASLRVALVSTEPEVTA